MNFKLIAQTLYCILLALLVAPVGAWVLKVSFNIMMTVTTGGCK